MKAGDIVEFKSLKRIMEYKSEFDDLDWESLLKKHELYKSKRLTVHQANKAGIVYIKEIPQWGFIVPLFNIILPSGASNTSGTSLEAINTILEEISKTKRNVSIKSNYSTVRGVLVETTLGGEIKYCVEKFVPAYGVMARVYFKSEDLIEITHNSIYKKAGVNNFMCYEEITLIVNKFM